MTGVGTGDMPSFTNAFSESPTSTVGTDSPVGRTMSCAIPQNLNASTSSATDSNFTDGIVTPRVTNNVNTNIINNQLQGTPRTTIPRMSIATPPQNRGSPYAPNPVATDKLRSPADMKKLGAVLFPLVTTIRAEGAEAITKEIMLGDATVIQQLICFILQ